MPPADQRVPLTLDELIAGLIRFRALYPDQGPRPVLLLNTDDDGDGLVTDVELECFDEEQGRVTVLSPATSLVDPVTAWLTSIDRRLAAIERRLDELAAHDG